MGVVVGGPLKEEHARGPLNLYGAPLRLDECYFNLRYTTRSRIFVDLCYAGEIVGGMMPVEKDDLISHQFAFCKQPDYRVVYQHEEAAIYAAAHSLENSFEDVYRATRHMTRGREQWYISIRSTLKGEDIRRVLEAVRWG